MVGRRRESIGLIVGALAVRERTERSGGHAGSRERAVGVIRPLAVRRLRHPYFRPDRDEPS